MRSHYEGGGYESHFNPSEDDKLMILACQIRIWTATPDDWSKGRPDIAQITEAHSIDINKSFKDPISTCILKFPRGTMISKTITKNGKDESVNTGSGSDGQTEKKQSKATQNGDVEVPGSTIDENGNTNLSVWATRNEYGIVEVSRQWGDRPEKKLASEDDFGIGSRIEVQAGYVYDEEEFLKVKSGEQYEGLDVIFTGRIMSCAIDRMIEVKCEDLMAILKTVKCPDVHSKSNYKVNDFLKSGGRFDLLKGTGLQLSKVSMDENIQVGTPSFNSNNNPLDLFYQWSKGGIAVFLDSDGKTVKVAYIYNSENRDEKDKSYVGYREDGSFYIIQSDWHVASENLGWSRIDKRYIAVKASTSIPDGQGHKQLSVVYRNIAKDSDEKTTVDSFVRIHDSTKAGKMKRKNGTKGSGRVENQAYLDDKNYMIVKYQVPYSTDMNMEKLKKAAKEYYMKYSNVGVNGSVTCFGDVKVVPGQIICYINPIEPLKNGYYLVEAVNIRFGMQGYRKELKMAYRVEAFKEKIIYVAGED